MISQQEYQELEDYFMKNFISVEDYQELEDLIVQGCILTVSAGTDWEVHPIQYAYDGINWGYYQHQEDNYMNPCEGCPNLGKGACLCTLPNQWERHQVGQYIINEE